MEPDLAPGRLERRSSVIYPLPSWQSAVESVIGSNARGIPDLAWNAAVNGDVLHDRLRLAGGRAVRGLAGRAAVVIAAVISGK